MNHPLYTPKQSPIEYLDTTSITPEKLQQSRKSFLDKNTIWYSDPLVGKIKYWDVVSRSEPSNVVVLGAITREKTLIILDQFRVPVKEWIIENPAGLVDENETYEDAVRRELAEETGYQIGHLRFLGRTPSSAGMTDEVPHIYLATDCTPNGQGPKRESSEWIHQYEIPVDIAPSIIERAEQLGRAIDPKIWRILREIGKGV